MPRPSVTLSTLRGFEAAARLASFASAANELNLSHSAVSHQIKQLESELGQPLFRRVGRSVVLTDAGKDFSRSIRDVFQRLEDGVARLAPYQKPGGVILYTTMAFARGFLLPRMTAFRAALPGIDLWLDTSGRSVDFQTDEVDLLITQEIGVAAPEASEADLLADMRVPMASPALIARMQNLGKSRLSLDDWPLLHDESHVTWRDWFKQCGCPASGSVAGANFSDHALMIDAAAAGNGVALGSVTCAAGYLRSGALVTLEGPTFVQPPYRLYRALDTIDEDPVLRVHDWLVSEAVSAAQGAAPYTIFPPTSVIST